MSWLTATANGLHWTVSPIVDLLAWLFRTLQHLHDLKWMFVFRWCVYFFRVLIGAQLMFAAVVAVQIMWSLLCIQLCNIGDLVKTNQNRNSLADFLHVYYWGNDY